MILIASQNSDLTKSWRQSLSSFELFETDAQDKRQLFTLIKKGDFKIVIVDIHLLGNEGIDAIASLHEHAPQTYFVIMTPDFNQREELFAVLFGARAYIPFDINAELLNKVITRVLEGEIWVDRHFVGRLITELEAISREQHSEAEEIEKGIMSMTPRENEIAELIATGASNRRIAEKLSISERTVKAHLGVIFKKIGINDRLQLALYMNKYHQLSNLWHNRRTDS